MIAALRSQGQNKELLPRHPNLSLLRKLANLSLRGALATRQSSLAMLSKRKMVLTLFVYRGGFITRDNCERSVAIWVLLFYVLYTSLANSLDGFNKDWEDLYPKLI